MRNIYRGAQNHRLWHLTLSHSVTVQQLLLHVPLFQPHGESVSKEISRQDRLVNTALVSTSFSDDQSQANLQ